MRFSFQIAVASDGIQSFALFNYACLDGNPRAVGYFNEEQCGGWKRLETFASDRLTLTSNIGVIGTYVLPLKC